MHPQTPVVADVPCNLIDTNPDQPRRTFDPEELEALAASIRNDGILQPLLLRPHGDSRYQVIAGERRLRAADLAGLTQVPAYIRTVDDDALLRLALLENTARVDLNIIEEAHAFQELLERTGITQAELAAAVGKSRAWVTHSLGMLRLPAAVQRKAAAGELTRGHVKALVGVADPAQAERLADRVIAEGLSVRSLEELVVLGDSSSFAAPTRRTAPHRAGPLLDVAEALSGWLDTRVTVHSGKHKGRIVVEFSAGEDLERILQALAAPAPNLLTSPRTGAA